jgi:hypothetical protein
LIAKTAEPFHNFCFSDLYRVRRAPTCMWQLASKIRLLRLLRWMQIRWLEEHGVPRWINVHQRSIRC